MLLHKYTKAHHGMAYLREGYLRFSPLPEFNDPFEMHPFLNALGTPEQEEAVVRRVEEENEGFLRLTPDQRATVLHHMRTVGLAETRKRMVDDLHATIGVLSLVKNNSENLLMWAHYADSHKGCVLEFDGSHPWFQTKHGTNQHEFLGVLQEVKYSATRPQVSLLELGKEELLVKAECWRYENEWRMLLNLSDCNTQECDGKKVVGLFPVAREALVKVYLGVNIDPLDRERFLAMLPHGHPTGLFQLHLDDRDFALVADQIN